LLSDGVMAKVISVVDLFAGPGGLGEGFSSYEVPAGKGRRHRSPFRIALSVEKEAFAHSTLRLRSFYRLLKLKGQPLDQYYAYVSGKVTCPYTPDTREFWEQAGEEALQLEIGVGDANSKIHEKVKAISEANEDWILIGGPPCQAYSLVGRARNKGVDDYSAEKDQRHFLYKHYLELISKFRPAVFVMENVKGILSSKVSGSKIFTKILEDLRVADGKGGKPYRIYSLSEDGVVYTGPDSDVDPHDFIVRSEQYGIPQARHRVILVGIREDLAPTKFSPLAKKKRATTVLRAISDLPKLRSGLSTGDSQEAWKEAVIEEANRVVKALRDLPDSFDQKKIKAALREVLKGNLPHQSRGALQHRHALQGENSFVKKLRDPKLPVILNNESRGHMKSDLGRYLYAAAYAKVNEVSPSQEHFPKSLAPDHENWFTGKFADRFRVQVRNEPSTTVTCHISKDGHYYIHPDPRQCRSLTVREAARLQTFPDNYFFEGNRTEQYIQVGNAVPPLLAREIAQKIWKLLK
jgi:DNA (cytosine-5)-methyltransferase 1